MKSWFQTLNSRLAAHPLEEGGLVAVFAGALWFRSTGNLFVSLAIVSLWFAMKRLQWLASPPARLFFIAVAFLSDPLFTAYGNSRYKSREILLTALLLLAWSLRAGVARLVLLVALALVTATAGPEMVVFTGLLALFALAWLRGSAVRPVGAIIGGLAAGVAIGMFGSGLRWHPAAAGGALHRVLPGPLCDPGMLAMMLILLLVISQRSLCIWDRISEKLAIAGLVCSYAIVAGLELTVHYDARVHWMNQLVLAGFVCAVLERALNNISAARRVAILLLLAVALLSGTPLMAGFRS